MARSDPQCALCFLRYARRRYQSGNCRFLPLSVSSKCTHVNLVGIPTRQNDLRWRGRPTFGESPRLLTSEGC